MKMLAVRVEDEEHEHCKAAAHAAHKSLSQWMRDIVREKAGIPSPRRWAELEVAPVTGAASSNRAGG
jgi:hypothetical protein